MKRPFIIKDKRIIVTFLIAWVLVMFLAIKDDVPIKRINNRPTGEWITATHPIYGFSLVYPDKWNMDLFDESGRRGADEIKLMIHGQGSGFNGIVVKWVEFESPTLADAASWDDNRLVKLGRAASNRGEARYRQVSLEEDEVSGIPVLRRIYKLRDGQFEAVYIARANDFVILTLQTTPDYHDRYKEDFDRVVESFQPSE